MPGSCDGSQPSRFEREEVGFVSKSGTPPMGGGRGVEVVYASTRKEQKSSALTVTRRELWRMMPMRTYLRRGRRQFREVAGAVKPATSWVLPLVTAAVLPSVFCLYYFVYLAAQREYHTNRNFRSLAVLGGRRSSDPDCICGATTVAGSWR